MNLNTMKLVYFLEIDQYKKVETLGSKHGLIFRTAAGKSFPQKIVQYLVLAALLLFWHKTMAFGTTCEKLVMI